MSCLASGGIVAPSCDVSSISESGVLLRFSHTVGSTESDMFRKKYAFSGCSVTVNTSSIREIRRERPGLFKFTGRPKVHK